MQSVLTSLFDPRDAAIALRFRARSTLFVLAAAGLWHLNRLRKLIPRNCPLVRGHFLFGFWPEFLEASERKEQYEFLHDFFGKCGRKTYACWHPLAFHAVFTMDRSNVEYILKKNFSNFPKGLLMKGRLQDLLGDGIFNSDGASWYHQRKTVSHMFTAKLFKEHIWAAVEHKAAKVRSILEEAAKPGVQVDVFNLMNRFTLDSIGEIGFGKNIGSLEDPSSPFLDSFDKVQQQVVLRDMQPFWWMMKILNLGSERTLRTHLNRIDAYSRAVVRELCSALGAQEKGLKEGAVAADARASQSFVGLFLADAKKRGEELSEDYLRDLVLNFLIAGRDTTAQALAWTWFFLASYPKVAAKVRKEIAEVCSDRKVQMDDLKKLPYLTAVLNETMRLRPSVPIDAKQTAQRDTLPDGTILPAGTMVYYNIWSLNRDTDTWGADATVFRPERWLEMPALPDSYTYPVFNAGPRECLGKRLAMVEMQGLIAIVLPHVTLQLAVSAEKITYDWQLTLGMASGLPCLVRPALTLESEADILVEH